MIFLIYFFKFLILSIKLNVSFNNADQIKTEILMI